MYSHASYIALILYLNIIVICRRIYRTLTNLYHSPDLTKYIACGDIEGIYEEGQGLLITSCAHTYIYFAITWLPLYDISLVDCLVSDFPKAGST